MLIAAAHQCHRTATASITPDGMLGELKRAIDLLQVDTRLRTCCPAAGNPKKRGPDQWPPVILLAIFVKDE